MNRPERLFTGLLVVALLGAGWAYYRAQTRQAATLARITALETCLVASNEQRAWAAKNTVAGLSEAVRKNHNQRNDAAVLQQAQKIQAHTKALLATLHQLRQSWLLPEHGTKLRQLPMQLAQYVRFVQPFTLDTSPLTQPAAQMVTTEWLGEFATKAELKPAALALLTRLETQVRQLEAEALVRQASKVQGCWWFEKISALAIPTSEIVAPGEVYQAKLFLAVASSTGRMSISANGVEVPIDLASGQGVVQFKVPAARPGQPYTVRATWHGRIQMPWAAGDTVLETTVPYFIIKPRPH